MRILWLGLSLALGAASAHVSAAPYWVAWEGNDYPENEGWTRYIFGGGASTRTLQNGTMTIDSLASPAIADFCEWTGIASPAIGEQFVMQWRVRVTNVVDNDPRPFDPAVYIFSDNGWGLGFELGVAEFRSVFEDSLSIPYAPGMFHEFELRSFDMRSYQLWLDGNYQFDGAFWEPAVSSDRLGWGDAVQGASSLHDWDYVRFGVVPEPSTVVLVTIWAALTLQSTRIRRRQ